MRRAPQLVLLALAQIVTALSLAQPAHAGYVSCTTGYDRLSAHSPSVNYEEGYGYGHCPDERVSRIDVRLTYVYCPTSTSCNSTGSNFASTSFATYFGSAPGGIYNLRGYYKIIVRTSFTLYPGQTWLQSARMGNNMVAGSCGSSGTNYFSCAYESAVFQRGV